MSIFQNKNSILFGIVVGLAGAVTSVYAALQLSPKLEFGFGHIIFGMLLFIVFGLFTYLNRRAINDLTIEPSQNNLTIARKHFFGKSTKS